MALKQCLLEFTGSLQPLYTPREAALIAQMVLEKVTGYSRLDIITRPEALLTTDHQARIEKMLGLLREKVPVQYVLGEAWFCGMAFRVTDAVLIPRPETEELVGWIVEDLRAGSISAPVIVDLGTGSGCIAISLRAKLPSSRVRGLDFSRRALEVARENSARLGFPVEMVEGDMLGDLTRAGIPPADIIVSNPPYIPRSGAGDMQAQVTEHEPHEALFVPDEDPLLFYKAIVRAAAGLFDRTGTVYVETHEDYAREVAHLFETAGAREVTLRADMQQRPRMVRARFSKSAAEAV